MQDGEGGMNNPNVEKLKYRIIYCSGEDQDCPVTELLDPSSNSRGWQSQKFCDYPQEIIVQFPQLVKLKQLQFLSHQSKIASKIELFAFLPSGQQALTNQIPLNEIEFKRLGYLSLDPNERSGFQARELKSVYVDAEAVLLKLIFHKCHLNNFNVFNQIGLIALNCIGEPVTLSRQAEASLPSKSAQFVNDPSPSPFDSDTALQIKKLQQEKEAAVKEENFDLAKQIKDTVDRLKSIGQELTKLEELKRRAVHNEDFDAAKKLKMQIELLRQSAFHPGAGGGGQMPGQQPFDMMQQPPQLEQPMMSQQNFGGQRGMMSPPNGQSQNPGSSGMQFANPLANQMNNMNLNPDEQSRFVSYPGDFGQPGQNPLDMQANQPNATHDVFGSGPSSVGNARSSNQFGGPDSYAQPGMPMNQPDMGGGQDFGQSPPTKSTQFQPPPQQPPVQTGPLNVDDMVIPALKSGAGANQMSEYPDGQDPNAQGQMPVDELSADHRKAAEPLIDMFGEADVTKLFSKTWQLRDEAISSIEAMVMNEHNQDEAFVNGVGVVRQTIQDKMAGVAQKSMNFMAAICQTFPNISLDGHRRGQFNQYTDIILSTLAEKLGDNLQKIRASAEEAFIASAGHPQIGVQLCLGYLTNDTPPPSKTKNNKGKKPALSSKQVVAKYTTLYRMLRELQFSRDQQIQATKYAVKGISHSSNDVRVPAYDCMGELYRMLGGDELSKHYTGLRQASLDALMAKFTEIDEDKGLPTKQPKKAPQKQEVIETNIGKGPKKTLGKKVLAAKQQQNAYDDDQQENYGAGRNNAARDDQGAEQDGQCTFCNRYDPAFNEESIDIHYWKECPMLTCCWECEQVIEVQHIEEHLLEECQHMEKYKFCPKCKSVLLVDEFDGHECIRADPPGAVRCPLCSETVYPNDKEGWQKHILDDKCPGNPRLPRP